MLIVNTNYIIIFLYYRVDIRRELLYDIDRRRQFIPIGYSEIAENRGQMSSDIRRELLHNIDRHRQLIPIGYSEIAENRGQMSSDMTYCLESLPQVNFKVTVSDY